MNSDRTMSQDLDTVLLFTNLQQRASNFSGAILHALSESISSTNCSEVDSDGCRDDFAAFNLKIIAIVAILIASISGVVLPLVGKKRRFLRTDGNLFSVAKAFAAGVILATGFVHMLPDGDDALTDPCLPTNPWSKFPFSSFIAMFASLGTLIIDFVGTQYYEQKHEKETAAVDGIIEPDRVESGLTTIQGDGEEKEIKGNDFTEEEGSGIHVVCIHAHAAAHGHSHAQGGGFCDGQGPSQHMHGHSHSHVAEDESISSHVRHVVVSQVLELGIVSHSVLIGLSVGVSHSPCTIRPLIAALSFHQFFEGFALGGCISQAQFKPLSTTLMACFFAITTPLGIGIGTMIASFYNPNSPRALVVEGILDSISAGILVYMALVDLIAVDFLSKRIRCNTGLQIGSYFSLFLGASLMSLLAIWT